MLRNSASFSFQKKKKIKDGFQSSLHYFFFLLEVTTGRWDSNCSVPHPHMSQCHLPALAGHSGFSQAGSGGGGKSTIPWDQPHIPQHNDCLEVGRVVYSCSPVWKAQTSSEWSCRPPTGVQGAATPIGQNRMVWQTFPRWVSLCVKTCCSQRYSKAGPCSIAWVWIGMQVEGLTGNSTGGWGDHSFIHSFSIHWASRPGIHCQPHLSLCSHLLYT